MGNPEIFIELCPPLYEDIVKYGVDNFEFWVQAFKTTRENAYYHQYEDIDRELICYNDFDDETFTGIKCIETEVIYKTAGEAARAHNLKSKNSILKALNDHTKTAAKMHWYSIDKATEERSRKAQTEAEPNSQQEQQNNNPPLIF